MHLSDIQESFHSSIDGDEHTITNEDGTFFKQFIDRVLLFAQEEWKEKKALLVRVSESTPTKISDILQKDLAGEFSEDLGRVFSISVASEACCERVFSMVKDIVGLHRWSLDPTTLLSLLVVSTYQKRHLMRRR
jgi:hypothetical protein